MFVIRRYEPGDLEEVRELIDESMRGLTSHMHSEAALSRHDAKARTDAFANDLRHLTYFVAVSEVEEIVGCGGCSISPDNSSARIREVFVHPLWTRRGIATALVERAIDQAEQAGVEELWVQSSLYAVPLYESLGFTKTSPPLDGDLPSIRLERQLS